MHNPTSKQVQKVIDTLTSVLPMIKKDSQLDMAEGHVNRGHSCGSIHCHGGWYAIGYLGLKKRHFLVEAIFPQVRVGYMDGAAMMAEDLGFINNWQDNMSFIILAIERWAAFNPAIWGNSSGANMFSHNCAFYNKSRRPEGAKSVQDIIDHWTEVRDRIIAQEQIESVIKVSQEEVSEDICENVTV